MTLTWATAMPDRQRSHTLLWPFENLAFSKHPAPQPSHSLLADNSIPISQTKMKPSDGNLSVSQSETYVPTSLSPVLISLPVTVEETFLPLPRPIFLLPPPSEDRESSMIPSPSCVFYHSSSTDSQTEIFSFLNASKQMDRHTHLLSPPSPLL